MSLALILASSSKLMIAGDSRSSLKYNGIDYACGYVKKIEQIGNSVLFASGHAVVCRRIMEAYKVSPTQDATTLKSITKRELEKYIEEFRNYNLGKDFDVKEKLCADMTLCCFENNTPVIYNIASKTNYRVIREVCDYDESAFAAVGTHVEEAVAVAKRLSRLHPLEIYREVYSQLADEKVGGVLNVYTLTNGHVTHSLECPIIDRKHVRFYQEQFQLTNEDDSLLIRILELAKWRE